MEKGELEVALVTMNRQQAADHFGVHLATVKRAIKRYGINYKKKSGGCHLYRNNPLDPELELSQEQEDILTGSLLADGFMLTTNIFRIKQKYTRREYVQHLHSLLSPFSTPIRTDKARKPTRVNGKVSHRIEDWKGGYTKLSSFSTRCHPIFESLRSQWYPEGCKIVPEFDLNETILTHWYLQDGSHNRQRHYYKFSTQSFSEGEVTTLAEKLNRFCGTRADVQLWEQKPVIIVTKTKGEDVLTDIFRRTIPFKCFQYKI